MADVVKKFLHTRMRVSNLKETVRFYQTVFGLKVSREHQSPRGSQLVFLSVPNSEEEIDHGPVLRNLRAAQAKERADEEAARKARKAAKK